MKIKERRKINQNQKGQMTVFICLFISFLIVSPCKATLAGQASGASEVELIFPKIPRFYVGFDFKNYTMPDDLTGKKYTKSTILNRTLFIGSSVAFEIPSESSTASFIAMSAPVTSANIDIGLIDSGNNEYTVNATVVSNVNESNNYTIYTDSFPTGIAEGLGTLVTIDGDSNTVIERTQVFITKTIAERDSIPIGLKPSFTRAITIVNNFQKGNGRIFYSGSKLPGKTLTDGATTYAKKKSGLSKIYLFPTGIRGRIARGFNYGEVLQQRCKMKDKTISGQGLGVAITLWGIQTIEFSIPVCEKRCGAERISP